MTRNQAVNDCKEKAIEIINWIEEQRLPENELFDVLRANVYEGLESIKKKL